MSKTSAESGELRAVDGKARISLPKDFANATVLLDRVGDNEIRIRKARVVAEDDVAMQGFTLPVLSDRDRDLFLSLLENPPEPTAALRRLMKKRGR